MIEWEQMANAGIVILLLATIYYVQQLNRKLRILQTHKESLQNHLQKIVTSLEDVQNHFDTLHDESRGLIRTLAENIQKAQALKDDLEYISSRAEKQADKLFEVLSPDKKPAAQSAHILEVANHTPAAETATPQGEGDNNKAALMRLLRRMR